MALMQVRAGNSYRELATRYDKRLTDFRKSCRTQGIPDHVRMIEEGRIMREYDEALQRLDGAHRYQREQDLGINVQSGMWERIADAPIMVEEAEDDFTLEQGDFLMNILKTKIVGVKFTNGNSEAPGYDKLYQYLTDDLTIAVDDYCIVMGPSGAPSVVRVYEDNMVNIRATKMILSKIDVASYREKQRLLVQRAAALKRLEEIEKEQNAAERYKTLATRSDEARQLLELLGMMTPSTSIEGTVVEQGSDTPTLNEAADTDNE